MPQCARAGDKEVGLSSLLSCWVSGVKPKLPGLAAKYLYQRAIMLDLAITFQPKRKETPIYSILVSIHNVFCTDGNM